MKERGLTMKLIPTIFFMLGTFILVSGSADLNAQQKTEYARQTPLTAPVIEEPRIKDDYIIGVDDVLSINVWKEPDFSIKELLVRPDGKISLPLLNDIQAGGLNTKELRQNVADKLKDYVESPYVTVTVLKSQSRPISVVGQVARPGAYQLSTPITVLELIARAGGLSEYAKVKDIKIIRKENGKTLQFAFNYKEAIQGINLKQNIQLQIGDVVLVP
jgi:polysaccharide biosynthesis/export protein